MDTYLTIMVTVLVATQVIRIAQNTIQLHRQNKLIKKEIAHLGDVTQEDFDNQRKAYKLAIEYFERANITQGQNGLNLFNGWSEQGEDTLDNMLPACRSCNHYKSRSTLEGFRKMVENMPTVLMRDSVTYKNAVRFGLVTPTPHPVKFYFEQLGR